MQFAAAFCCRPRLLELEVLPEEPVERLASLRLSLDRADGIILMDCPSKLPRVNCGHDVCNAAVTSES